MEITLFQNNQHIFKRSFSIARVPENRRSERSQMPFFLKTIPIRINSHCGAWFRFDITKSRWGWHHPMAFFLGASREWKGASQKNCCLPHLGQHTHTSSQFFFSQNAAPQGAFYLPCGRLASGVGVQEFVMWFPEGIIRAWSWVGIFLSILFAWLIVVSINLSQVSPQRGKTMRHWMAAASLMQQV